MEEKYSKYLPVRILIYLLGIVLVSIGIVLCKKSNLGISPISSVPYVLEYIVPISFGALTMLFHLVNIVAQMALVKKVWDIKLLLQIPLAVVFGQTINFFQKCISIDNGNAGMQWLALGMSVLFTAVGMVCMLDMKLVTNPPDGVVKEISEKYSLKFGNVKIMYDVTMVIISVLLGIICCKKIMGIGIGTLVSAIFIGKCVSLINHVIKQVSGMKNIDPKNNKI